MEHVRKKVLWMTHTDAGYKKLFANQEKRIHTGTWIEALLKPYLIYGCNELGVIFHAEKKEDKIRKYNNVTYFPVFDSTKQYALSRIGKKILGRIIWNELMDEYLKIIENFRPDIIHIFGTEEDFGLITKYTDVPVVLSIQGNLTVYSWKYFSGITKFDLFRIFNFKKFIRFSTHYSEFRLFKKRSERERRIFENLKFIIGRTDWDKRVAKALSPNSIYFYNDEALREEFYNIDYTEPKRSDKIVITTISGPAVYKGLETVFKAINILNGLDMDFVWNIAGITEEENIYKAVKNRLGEDFPTKNFKLSGKLNAQEIIDLFNNTNLYIMPSHIENSPLTLSEAMIMGLPIIATYSGGIPSRISDSVEGTLIQSGDPWSLAGSILEVLEFYDLAIKRGVKARKRAIERHQREKIVSDLDQIYSKILLLEF